jgi:AcrR family transcriptional regulator
MANIETGLNERILETASELFIARGYHGMSMREISEALGVSKPALYYYFKDKEELFLEIMRHSVEEMSDALDRILADPESASDKIRDFTGYVLRQPTKTRAMIRLASQEITQLSLGSRQAFDKIYREKFIGKIQRIVRDGVQSGEFRDLPVETAVWGLLGIMFPYFYPDHSGDSPVPDETIDEVIRIYLNGITPIGLYRELMCSAKLGAV